MPTAFRTVFDAVYRFYDHALNDNEYLQPQKLHRMLYLAQGYYGAAHYAKRLYPATFVADAMGPMEPNVYQVLENGRPDISLNPAPDKAVHFVESVWRQFGHHTVEHLTGVIKNQPPYAEAFRNGPGTLIPHEAMVDYFKNVKSRTQPGAQEVERPRVMRSHKGKPVNTTSWAPRKIK